jgi:protein phosphatase methylesterase 1
VEITSTIECQVIAIDLRGHGNTKSNDDSDLSLDTLAEDVVEVLNKLFGDSEPPVILVGHSMGGAIAVQCSHLIKSAVGLCVIDVVEGTALDALSSMQSILRGRPSHFKSIQHAIQWWYCI